jgi:hypothetical protein
MTREKTKNQMGGCCAEGRITDIRGVRMEEKSGKYGRMEAAFEGGQGPERAVVPWMDVWMNRHAELYALLLAYGGLTC